MHLAHLWEQRTHVGIVASRTIPLINAPSLKMKSGLLKIVPSGWRQMVGILRRKESAVVVTMSKKIGVLLSQESWVFAMLMGLPTPTVERSIMELIVVGTQPTPQSFTRNRQQKALFLTLLYCPSHELILKSNKGSKPKTTTSFSSAGKSATANHVVLPDSVKAMLSQLSDSVHTPTEQVLMESVVKSLGLN
jgi:hypothetical protein